MHAAPACAHYNTHIGTTTFVLLSPQCLPDFIQEIISYNCQKLVKTVPFFERAHPEFVMDVVTKLQFEVILKGKYVIKAGTLGQKMYFVQSGVVDVLTEDRELMTSLSDGSHFGGLCVCVHVCTIFIIFGCTIKSTQMRVIVATCFAAESATGTSPASCRCGLGWTNSCICVPLCAPSRNMPVD